MIILSDENKFWAYGIKGRKILWQKREAVDKKILMNTVKHGGEEVMIWVCIASIESTIV